MWTSLLPWVADALVILGLSILTISLWGVFRMPDLYSSLHALSKSTALGVSPLLLAAGIESQTILLRGLLVLGFLLLTAPVSSHAIARAFWREEQVSEADLDPRTHETLTHSRPSGAQSD